MVGPQLMKKPKWFNHGSGIDMVGPQPMKKPEKLIKRRLLANAQVSANSQAQMHDVDDVAEVAETRNRSAPSGASACPRVRGGT